MSLSLRGSRSSSTCSCAHRVPAEPPVGPLRLDVVRHERHLAHLKHVGEVGKTFFLRHAAARGFDDAAFVDPSRSLGEATIWNLAFWDGESVIWPRAGLLPGITMQVLARRLAARGVAHRTVDVHAEDLGVYSAAVVMNSWTPGIPVDRIGDHQFTDDEQLVRVLHAPYADESLVTV
ncbi:aminotransferase class IV [Rhodococcus tibetensis]|uniref:Aminotransferase class IV n=1 Tax=Rhodococcus tibetensis TaxID=2965064 RepID=A0ABT1QF01_9NOCA|nr:aminotransferase class IV [Rhodococcus sp. FXJ9.536]MCQ4119712.1 aminotransferase class IV [Rhodococcus sp. FXJ9.536]